MNNGSSTRKLSCIDCRVGNCDEMNKKFPDFCVTTNMNDDTLKRAMQLYEEEENKAVTLAAANVEAEFYCKLTRVEEVAEFAKKMGYKKLGIATCAGLLKESNIVAKILRNKGFEVYGVACKAGTQRKTSVGIDPECEKIGCNMCNPILQATLLNDENTDFNIIVGLCVGHDSLFNKYSNALTTTLIAKDRVLAHNPAAALYLSESYYSKVLK